MRCSITTDLVDFLDPSGGRTGAFAPSASIFSLSSSAGALTAGEAGIVLSRFLSGAAVVERPVEVALPAVPGRVVRPAVVAVVFRRVLGLVAAGRVVVDGRNVVLLAGVPTTLRLVEVDERSAVVVGAIDIRLGLAEMPSCFSSFLSSVTELSEVRDLWVAVEGVVEEGGLRAVLETVERTGGLLRDEDVVVLDVEVGAVREAVVDGVVREVVVGLEAVTGRRAVVVPALGVAFSSLLLSAMTRAVGD